MSVRLSLIVLAAASPALASISYTFDTDSQGWGIVGGATDFQWDGSLGNGDLGAIRARDLVGGAFDSWFFSAPTADLGDMSDLYGFDLQYDIMSIQGIPDTNDETAEILLVGGGIEIGFSFDDAPLLGSWISRSVTVDSLSGWRYVDSLSTGTVLETLVSQADLMTVLANLESLRIRGEYTNGEDQAALDNVFFVPAPGALSLLGLSGLIVSRRRRG